jgi:hypothetical protein
VLTSETSVRHAIGKVFSTDVYTVPVGEVRRTRPVDLQDTEDSG